MRDEEIGEYIETAMEAIKLGNLNAAFFLLDMAMMKLFPETLSTVSEPVKCDHKNKTDITSMGAERRHYHCPDCGMMFDGEPFEKVV